MTKEEQAAAFKAMLELDNTNPKMAAILRGEAEEGGLVSGLARHMKEPITLKHVLPVVLAALVEKLKK